MSAKHKIAAKRRWNGKSKEERSKRMSAIKKTYWNRKTLKEKQAWSRRMLLAKLKKNK